VIIYDRQHDREALETNYRSLATCAAGATWLEPRTQWIIPILTAGESAFGTGVIDGTRRWLAAQAAFCSTTPPRVQEDLASTTTAAGEGEELGSSLDTTLLQLKKRADLSWGEVAEALGVSSRSIHLWMKGARISPRHARRIAELSALVATEDQGNPARTRSRLYAPTTDGTSRLEGFARASRPERKRPLSSQRPADFLSSEDEEVEPPTRVIRASSTMSEGVEHKE
jgi:transcriptional regulator with XRE-family HTH domain